MYYADVSCRKKYIISTKIHLVPFVKIFSITVNVFDVDWFQKKYD